MRMLPARFPDGAPSSAERRVFAALEASKVGGTVLHSLNLPEHEHKLTAELDFVVILQDLVLAIEVKGGRVAQRNGLWTYTDRYNVEHHSAEGPFKQVTSGMHALRKRVRDRLPAAQFEGLAFGTMVVTPDVDLPTSIEWSDETYLGRGPFSRSGGIDKALARAASYWIARQSSATAIRDDMRRALLAMLRPDFERVPNLASIAGRLDSNFARLTEEQLSRLDIVMDSDRVLCRGGAGTGKTFLAIEIARRYAQQGESTLLVCRSPVLAAYLGRRLEGLAIDVRSLDQSTCGKRYERLVVDEGQDLANLDALEALDEVVQGGLEEGRWVFFHDPNRQAHLYDDHDPEAIAYLKEHADASPALKHNCRNTRDIAFNTRAATGADLGVSTAGAGPTVDTPEVADAEDEKRQLEAWLRRLRDDEVPMSDVTIVSHKGVWEESSAKTLKVARKGDLAVLTTQNAVNWPAAGLSWASAIDIKGLENRFVAVIDLDDLRSDASLDRLYVAMSRPRAGLWVAIPEQTLPRYKELLKANTPGALQAYGSNK